MPILKRFTGSNNGSHGEQPLPEREPDILQGRPGYPSYSMAALLERIEAQFNEEMADRQDILLAEQDTQARRALVQEVVEYILVTESVSLTADEKQRLIDAAYRNLFAFGPLDDYLADDAVVELTINGAERVSVRRFSGQPERVDSPFEDVFHLAQIIERMLTGAGVQLLEGEPFVEVGLMLSGRPARLSLVAPPLSPVLHLDMRLHLAQPMTLERLHEQGAINALEYKMLSAMASSDYGLLIVGTAGSGKTTLLQALLPRLGQAQLTHVVQRAAEIRPPEEMRPWVALPACADRPAVPFATQIEAALDAGAKGMVIDELRGDEAHAVWRALTGEQSPRCLLVLRSSPELARLRSAFEMMIRKGQPGVDSEAIHRALLERLPFVISTQIGPDGFRIPRISQWIMDDGALTLVSLVVDGGPTGVLPGGEFPIDGIL